MTVRPFSRPARAARNKPRRGDIELIILQ